LNAAERLDFEAVAKQVVLSGLRNNSKALTTKDEPIMKTILEVEKEMEGIFK
jgi:hypothetical protein